MGREVRITIDDDEVFERMKARKGALDLSWEEVLHRGLRETPEERSGESRAPGEHTGGPGGRAGTQDGRAGNADGRAHGSRRDERNQGATRRGRGPGRRGQEDGRSGRRGPDRGVGVEYDLSAEDASISDVVDEFKGHVQNQVAESIRESMRSVEGAGSDLDREMTELERAEDAVLRFPEIAGDDPSYQVPLRVRLETSRGGMDVDVVAVREGKSVDGMNRFDSETRRAINEHLARDGTVTLSFEHGEESYEVGPVLSWSRADDGRPTVSDVTVTEVLFDDAS